MPVSREGPLHQVDAQWTKLARAEPPGGFKLIREGSTSRIAPRGDGLLPHNPVLIGRQTLYLMTDSSLRDD
jgi:hypothetical protein